MIDLNLNPSRKELRLFAVLQVVFFAIIATLVYRRSGTVALPATILAISTAVGIAGYHFPSFMRTIYVVWMLAVYPIGWLVSHLILITLFYLVITPVGWLMRLCGHDPMQRKFDRHAHTYWQPRPQQNETRRYFRQY